MKLELYTRQAATKPVEASTDPPISTASTDSPVSAASTASPRTREPAKRAAEGIARAIDRRAFLRRLADVAFIGIAWTVLDWRNAPVAVGSHTACVIVAGQNCAPPCGQSCPGSRCSGEICTGGCSPHGCGGYTDASHYCWCTQGNCSTGGVWICCDCCCSDLGSCNGISQCASGGNAGCCLCKRWVPLEDCR